jgi:uncharacterized repeat protein (TIGR01451 family)
MKIFERVLGGATALCLVFGLLGPISASAATTPSMGAAAGFGVLASTYTNTAAGTTINGDLGYITGPATAPVVNGVTHINDGTYTSAVTAQGSALVNLNAQPCTFSFPAGAVNLSTEATHGPVGVFTPGVYCGDAAMDVGGPLTLSGSGTYIFRSVGALTSTAGAIVTLTGASACDIFWTPGAATTLAANTTFSGTIISNAGVTMGANTTLAGRSLAGGGTVTTDTNTITVPTCAAPVVPPSGGSGALTGNINVVKNVINDNGGTKTTADFPLFVNGTLVVSGETNNYPANSSRYEITESNSAGYTQSFSGDCDADGVIFLHAAENLFCIVTNNDIGPAVIVPPVPPLIDVVKVPNPLALPSGPGSVTYTYTLRNVGTVPVTNVTMVGDTCSPIVRISGDTDGDNQLDLTEVWVHTCTTTLTETHTNTVVATGWANGLSAVDVASATVVVGVPVVPPLIHVTKIPNPLTLGVGGGVVTYTHRVTNPGTVAVGNVVLTDNQCGTVSFVSGDTNGDTLLDASETWTYTCQMNVTQTTTNTVTVSGEANGFVVRDLAVAPVVVATGVPSLPVAGYTPTENTLVWAALAAALSGASLFVVLRMKRS